MGKRGNYFVIFLLVFFGFMIPVKASNVVDFSKTGSISVLLTDYEEEAVSGVEITIYHIANATSKDYNLSFEYVDAMKECGVNLSDIDDNSLVLEVSKCINSEVESYSLVSDDDGNILFSDLKLGVYLVTQSNDVDGYSNIESFLVKMPFEEDNTWKYDIEAEPKVDIYKTIDLVVRKEWNTNRTKLPKSVKIALYKGEKKIDTVVLSDDNGWTYTWENIEKSDTYNVKEIDVAKGYTVTYKNQGYSFIVTNTDSLAPTGQIYYPIVIMVSLGLIFVLLGTIQLKRTSNE